MPQLLISSSDVVLNRQRDAEGRPLKLVKDQTVAAKVLRAVSGRRAQLLIKGERVSAKTFLPLRAGQTIFLKVSRTGSRQVLKFMGEKQDPSAIGQSRLITSFGRSGPYAVLSRMFGDPAAPGDSGSGRPGVDLSRLAALVASMSLKSGTASPGFLQDLIKGSGLVWESKLVQALTGHEAMTPKSIQALVSGDLKALALQLLSDKPEMPEPALDQLKSFLGGLEKHQLLNHSAFGKAGMYLLPLPVLWPSALRFGQLLLDLGKDKDSECAGGNRMVNVSFLLTLTRLGEFRADFSVLKKAVTGSFGVATEEAHQRVASHLPELAGKLRAHGFSVRDISCRVLGPERLSGMSLLDRVVQERPDGVLNLVI